MDFLLLVGILVGAIFLGKKEENIELTGIGKIKRVDLYDVLKDRHKLEEKYSLFNVRLYIEQKTGSAPHYTVTHKKIYEDFTSVVSAISFLESILQKVKTDPRLKINYSEGVVFSAIGENKSKEYLIDYEKF